MNFSNTVFPRSPKGGDHEDPTTWPRRSIAITRIPPHGLEGQFLSLEGMSGAPKQTSAGPVCSRQVRDAACSCLTRVTPRVSAALCVGLQRLQRRESRSQNTFPAKWRERVLRTHLARRPWLVGKVRRERVIALSLGESCGPGRKPPRV